MLKKYSQPLQIRWSDIDQNRHLRHSVYYDYGTMLRINFLSEQGLTSEKMKEFNIGPVIFREEAIFKREIKLEDKVEIDVELVHATPDYGRWELRHNFIKQDGTLAAILTLDGAWVDTVKRKLIDPNELVQKAFDAFPRSGDFRMIAETSSQRKI